MSMKEKCQKLFDELVVNPEDWVLKWFDDYTHFTTDVRKIRERLQQRKIKLSDNSLYEGLESLSDRSFDGFVWKLVGELKNGIASRGQSVISHKHLAQFKKSQKFKEFLQAIIIHPLDNELFIKFNEWWASQSEVKHNRVLVNRIFAACAPAELSTAVDERKFNRVFAWLQSEAIVGRYEPPHSGDTWLSRNMFLLKQLRNVNRGGLPVEWISIFPWLLYEYMEKQLSGEGTVIAGVLSDFIEQSKTGDLRTKHLNRDIDGFQLRAGFGQGSQARIPWIVLLGAGQTTMEGIYPVYLYYRDQQKLLLCYGVSETKRPRYSWGEKVEQRFPRVSEVINNPARYGTSFVYQEYDVIDGKLQTPPDELEEHFHAIKSEYQRVLSESNILFPEQKEHNMPFSVDEFIAGVSSAELVVDESLPLAVCSALHANPFLLLTGLSGSGKTKLAQAFSSWIFESVEQVELIAVGADWTSNENLLGYPDALNPGRYRKPDNGVLDLILRAKDDPNNPYFLILDEMNLSHVERYFADFLSAMESGEAVSLHDDTGEDWNGVPAKLAIPKNLFVIGTVNVDETTYMFSPKVLDRANVIEFRVSNDEMKSFLENPAKPNLDALVGQGAKYAKAFVDAARQTDFALDEDLKAQVSAVLMEFFPSLKEAGAEFGYRTAHEICRFIHFHKELSGDEWLFESAMDAAIMQKLLPKLHGSKKKLGPVLETLLGLCLKNPIRPGTTPVPENLLTQENALYWGSLEKLARMRKRLAEHGFTSFAEA